MRSLVLAAIFVSLLGTAFGQGRQGQFWSVGGFGNVLYPGTGHAPKRRRAVSTVRDFRAGFNGRPALRNRFPQRIHSISVP